MIEYTDRESRQKFISEKFGNYLKGSVLNIGGGGKKDLLNYIEPRKYVELDIDGAPDLVINLDEEYPIPIDDNQFDIVICTEVLEHLEEFHRVFSELLRITNKYVIISLPNAWKGFFTLFSRNIYNGDSGKAGIDVGKCKKFYGLPLNKPIDRHRWFFSYTEAQEFFHKSSKILSYDIIDEFPIGGVPSTLKGEIYRRLIKFLFSENAYNDWFNKTYWCLIEKKQNK